MNQQNTKGIVLGRTDFGEADRIITVLTPHNGKLRLMAKGVRKIKSKLAGGIELFSVSTFTYIPGRGEIGTLVSVRLDHHYAVIATSIDRTLFGYDVLRIFNSLTEDVPDEHYFLLVESCLAALDDKNIPLDLLRLWLIVQILKISGYSIPLDTDSEGEALDPSARYTFDAERTVFVLQPQGSFTVRHLKLLKLVTRLESPKGLEKVIGASEVAGLCTYMVEALLEQVVHVRFKVLQTRQ